MSVFQPPSWAPPRMVRPSGMQSTDKTMSMPPPGDRVKTRQRQIVVQGPVRKYSGRPSPFMSAILTG